MKGAERFDPRQFESASGLRPASAFVLIGVVLLAVSAKAAHIAFYEGGAQPDAIKEESAPWPRFEIVDRNQRPLAVSVECFDLTISPRAMWLSHTPVYMAERIASVLAEEDPAGLLSRMLPMPAADAEAILAETDPDGSVSILRVVEPELLTFDLREARAVDRWIQTGSVDPETLPGAREDGAEESPYADGTPIEGLWLVPYAPGHWTFEWEPGLLLSKEMRAEHVGGKRPRPDRWTAKLLRDLATLVDAFGLPESVREQLGTLEGAARRKVLTDALWAELMPSTFRVVRRRIDPFEAHALSRLLADEAVSPWQMKLTPRLERRHPVRPGRSTSQEERASALDLPADLDSDSPWAPPGDDSFAVLGQWGVLGSDAALARARSERDRQPHLLDWEGLEDPVAKRAWELATRWRPESGLELSCAKELEDPRWRTLLRTESRTYSRRMRTVARDRRRAWHGRVPNYFESASDATDVPRFVTTLDAPLQESLHEELQGVLQRFDAAVVMGIVIDVETGDVLAIDSANAYPTSGFAPIHHAFTPGSTFKPVIMSIALDQGVVTPDEVFATHAPDGILVRQGNRAPRRIREAEGAPEEAEIRAEEGLAHSVNAVLVQVGLRVPAHVLRDRLKRLGYGSRPQIGLGPETGGYVPALQRGTWSPVYTHASVSFGHELTVSLWQHATAMASIARGGIARPLRLIAAVEQGDERWDLALEGGERVLSKRACADVRAMMALGAREGTGDRVASPAHCPEFEYVGTKTGTTEKVPTELCLHVELAHHAEHEREGTSCSREHLKAMRGKREHKGIRETCYTSSMCAIGRLSESDREVLAFIVVDEPRSKEKFGADVAGLAAVRTLRRASGLSPVYVAPEEADSVGTRSRDGYGSVSPAPAWFNHGDMPWADTSGATSTNYIEGEGF